jgi:phosphate transport system permease protein
MSVAGVPSVASRDARDRPPLRPAPGRQRLRRWRERGIEAVLGIAAAGAVAGLLLILVFVFREALPVLFDPKVRGEAGMRAFLSTSVWQPVGDVPKYGIAPLLGGTFKVVVVAMLFATPLAVLAALFASEFATPRARETLKPAVEMLAGIPSVVLGFFALMVQASWLQALTGSSMRLNALNAGIALGLGVIPVIFTVCEDAMRAVPRSYREASLALGASRAQTAWHVTLPAAGAGVSAGVLLGLARAVGETMIVLMASGNAAIVSGSVFDSARTLSASIAAELAEVVVGSPHWAALFFLGALLFTVTFTLNVIAGAFVGRLRKRLAGG